MPVSNAKVAIRENGPYIVTTPRGKKIRFTWSDQQGIIMEDQTGTHSVTREVAERVINHNDNSYEAVGADWHSGR